MTVIAFINIAGFLNYIAMESTRGRRKKQELKLADDEVSNENEESHISKKWTADEKDKLLWCLKVYGHKDLDKMKEELPCKSKEEIRKFLIKIHSIVRQKNPPSDMKYWLDKSQSEMDKSSTEKLNDFYQTAQIMKFLSVDGLVEDHPNPENCGGINFSAAYRLIYQSLMGYPLQPVNKATADFIVETLIEGNDHKNCEFYQSLIDFLKKKYQTGTDGEGSANGEKNSNASCRATKRAVYGRKRCAKEVVNQINAPPIKVFVEEGVNVSNGTKSFSLAIGDNKEMSTVIVPIPGKIVKDKLEETASQLWSNVEFNPLGLSDKWSRIPFSYD